jgi:hypothetical protein
MKVKELKIGDAYIEPHWGNKRKKKKEKNKSKKKAKQYFLRFWLGHNRTFLNGVVLGRE